MCIRVAPHGDVGGAGDDGEGVGHNGGAARGAANRGGRPKRARRRAVRGRERAHGPKGRAVSGELDAETWARRYELLLALPAFVVGAGGGKAAAAALGVPYRTLKRWLEQARALGAAAVTPKMIGADVPDPYKVTLPYEALRAVVPFQGESGATARAVLADFLDELRAGAGGAR